MIWIRAFIAGYAATLVFHQGMVWLLNLAGMTTFTPYSTRPVGPLAVPSVISLSFWAGLWGILLLVFLRRQRGLFSGYIAAIIFGAIFPSLVALAVVLPLKGGPFMAGWNVNIFIFALLVNGAWGFGTKYLLGR